MNADELVTAYHEALKSAASLTAAEHAAEDHRKIVLSALIVAAGDMPLSKAEHVGRSSEHYQDATNTLNTAREGAEGAKAEVEYLKTRWETWRTKMSMQ